MDGQAGFGDILRQTRERKGLDLAATARRLRIREDILNAIEESDFGSMPPRGYARNMIAGYARFLGLDATSVTRQYLDELQDYQDRRSGAYRRADDGRRDRAPQREERPYRQGRPRQQRRDSDLDGRRAGARPAARSRFEEGRRPSRSADRSGRPLRAARADERDLRRRASAEEALDARRRTRARRTNEQKARARGSYGPGMPAVYAGRDPGQERGPRPGRGGFASHPNDLPMNNGHLPSIYTDRGSILSDPRVRYVVAGVVALVVVVVLCFALFGHNAKAASDDVPNMPVTGLDDQEQQDEGDQSQEQVPTSFTFSYNVPEGTTTWVEVHVDGQTQQAETVTGPYSNSVECSGTLEFICANATGVTAKQDDADLTLEPTSTGVDLTLSFSDFIKQWAQDHPDVQVPDDVLSQGASGSTQASDGTASSGSGSAASSSQSTSGASTSSTSSASTSTSSASQGTTSSSFGQTSGSASH